MKLTSMSNDLFKKFEKDAIDELSVFVKGGYKSTTDGCGDADCKYDSGDGNWDVGDTDCCSDHCV